MRSKPTITQQNVNNQSKQQKTGGVVSLILAVLALGISGFLSLVAHGKSTVSVNGKVVDSDAAKLGGDLITGWLSMPLLVLAMVIAAIAILIAFIRLFKNTTVGRILCVAAIALGVWAINISVGLFSHYGNL